MTTRNPKIQRVIHAMLMTSKANGARTCVSEECVAKLLQKNKIGRQVRNLSKPVLKVVLNSITTSGYGNIKSGMVPAMPQWIREAKMTVKGCGDQALRRRLQRLASAMNNGCEKLGAKRMNDLILVCEWMQPVEHLIARMFNAEFENLVRFHNSGCGLFTVKRRLGSLAEDIRLQTKGRISGSPILPRR